MSEEDKDTVTEIIASNVSLSSITDIQSLSETGSKEDILKYAQDNLPEEDVEELEDILEKYVK